MSLGRGPTLDELKNSIEVCPSWTFEERKWLGRRRVWLPLVIALALLGVGAPLLGAEVRGGTGEQDIYHLPASEVVHDDLYVGAAEVIIDGVVEGDLVAAGGYIEVNGEVTGDVILAGGGVVINGKVGDDARVAGAGVTVAGAIGDDLLRNENPGNLGRAK